MVVEMMIFVEILTLLMMMRLLKVMRLIEKLWMISRERLGDYEEDEMQIECSGWRVIYHSQTKVSPQHHLPCH